jgi:hypothetical protein
MPPPVTRRQAIGWTLAAGVLPALPGCRASFMPLPATPTSDQAMALLQSSAEAHGFSHLDSIVDLNVSYDGHWRWLVGKIQPELVDSGFRGRSQERWLLEEGLVAQLHSGPQGQKKVVRRHAADGSDTIQVWFNGESESSRARLDAAALVVDAYSLFLLGPMLLVRNTAPRRAITPAIVGQARLNHEGRELDCEVLQMELRPGIGRSDGDRLELWIDRSTRLMHRVRMTLNGLESTRGALVDIDTFAHRRAFGIEWPTRFHERLLRPAPLDVHAWSLTGLDINRGESAEELEGPVFRGRALQDAAALRPSWGRAEPWLQSPRSLISERSHQI